MNSAQRKKFKKKVDKISARFINALEHVIANYGKDDEVITVADLKSLLDEMRNPA